jgi:hypothetical protein
MFTANNQVIFEEIYDENIQPTEEEILEYAEFIGIKISEKDDGENNDESKLMWIAREGVMAPLPKGWKPVQDPQGELYYFNFETGDSIWDHPCDNDYKKLVIEERKKLIEQGDNYKPSHDRRTSPLNTKTRDSFQNSSTNLRNDYNLLDGTASVNIMQYEEENDNNYKFKDNNEEEEEEIDEEINDKNDDEDEQSDASWKKKSISSEDSSDFQKPVDFGIDRETSMKLDKLNVMLMVGKEKDNEQQQKMNNNNNNNNKPNLTDQNDKHFKAKIENDLTILKKSLENEYNERRLELLEEKDKKIKQMSTDMEEAVKRQSEINNKQLLKEHEERLEKLRQSLNDQFAKEKEILRKEQETILNDIQQSYETEKKNLKAKFNNQIQKYLKTEQSISELEAAAIPSESAKNDTMDDREIKMYFNYIESKHSEKLDDRRKELQNKYKKVTKIIIIKLK